MLDSPAPGDVLAYTNPVYPKSFPDPFVLKFGGEYFAYCTGFAKDWNVFGVLRSTDLVNWSECGGAMKPLENSPPFYWAPEVTYDNGKFYLYYSVGNETLMELRVAVSDRPDGGFVDSERRLTIEDFAIDAHNFIDEDGEKYLFYATDFLDHTHIGTGTVVDRMLDWFTLEGNPRPVTRAKFDWQVYDPAREEKGGVRWHTVEGPTVLKRKNIYYEMFSGGNWQNQTYGVSFATADDIDTPDEWKQFSDGVNAMPILRTMPGIVGPGHNSVVRGPNNRELYCVYHRWTDHGRVMAIDRMDFAGRRIFVIGPTQTAQLAPFLPKNRHKPASVTESFLCELTASCAGRFGLRLANSFEFTIDPISKAAALRLLPDDTPISFKLPDTIDWTTNHLIRLELDHRRLRIDIDSTRIADTTITQTGAELSTFSTDQPIAIKSFELTEGFVELFDSDQPLEENGWLIDAGGDHHVSGGELFLTADGAYRMTKDFLSESLEAAVNFRMLDAHTGEFGILLGRNADAFVRPSTRGRWRARSVLCLTVNCEAKLIEISGGGNSISTPLPNEIQLAQYHQLRIVKQKARALCYFDDLLVGDVAVADAQISVAVFSNFAPAAIEMIRVIGI